jgi:pimeloyl-ACP methyl ester carboxylesterase
LNFAAQAHWKEMCQSVQTTDQVEIRIHNQGAEPTLIYLPGLHGDWTLVGGFRRALGSRARFVEVVYPRTLTWSLEQYAEAIETALALKGISRGWLLGESFGSQLVWAIAARKRFHFEGLIFAGGFVRHPLRCAVPVAEWLVGIIPSPLLACITFVYEKLLRFRYGRSPEVLQEVKEFIARRTDLDRLAAKHRLRLIRQNDLCTIAEETSGPVFMLSGLWDPIVIWGPVRRWMRCRCPALREFKILSWADHNVLGTASKQSAEVVMKWIRAARSNISTL